MILVGRMTYSIEQLAPRNQVSDHVKELGLIKVLVQLHHARVITFPQYVNFVLFRHTDEWPVWVGNEV